MANAAVSPSPQLYARIGGLLYLLLIAAGCWGQLFVRGTIIVAGDATATANNIMASPSLWRTGIGGDLLMHLCDVPVMIVFYVLLKPINRNLALLAVLFNLVQTAVLVANKMTLVIPLFLLGNAMYLKAFAPQQLHALAYVSLRAHDYGFGFGLIFFGAVCLIEGYLIRRSGYLPKALGVLMQVAGACYLLNSFALILAPAFASMLFPAIMMPPILAESSLAIWLVVKGVDLPKWEEKLRIAG
ncbi:MAG TPA: DUF4386 domain-containing protein [Thermoanaerobaculia bacterium]|jgi:hypothetical protein|nr:DUF4386 domain-containing protein [Thermoanaerobaculia bacterium]